VAGLQERKKGKNNSQNKTEHPEKTSKKQAH
jgi:hypothetical protein